MIFDGEVFDPKRIDPETDKFNKEVEELSAMAPPMETYTPRELRAQREAGKGVFGPVNRVDEATGRVIPGPDGDVHLRVIVPDRVNGVLLHFHGGGFMIGRAYYADEANLALANRCHVAIVSVDYRLAPEHPYPAAANDGEAAALWLLENAKSEFGTEELAIGGDSAGATLAVSTLLRMRDRYGAHGFSRANLVYGAYDLTLTPSVRQWGDRNLILSRPLLEWFFDNYVPVEKRMDPDVSPIYADLSGLPPALFTVGTLDPLLDDTTFMHARWLAAGNAAELAVYPGGLHGFSNFPLKIAQRARVRMDAFLTAEPNR